MEHSKKIVFDPSEHDRMCWLDGGVAVSMPLDLEEVIGRKIIGNEAEGVSLSAFMYIEATPTPKITPPVETPEQFQDRKNREAGR